MAGGTYSPYPFRRLVAAVCHLINYGWRHHPHHVNHESKVWQLRGCSQFNWWLSPLQRPLCIVGRAGEREKESARGTMGRGKRRTTFFLFPSFPARFLFFSIIAIFIGIPSGASEEERGLVMNAAWNIRQNLLGYFVGLFVCTSRGPYGDFSSVKI